MSAQITEAALLLAVQDFRLCRSLAAAALTLFLYDNLLTIPDEINFMWGSQWNRGRFLYTIARYLPMANVILDNIILWLVKPNKPICNFLFSWYAYTTVVTQIVIGIILILRLSALYETHSYNWILTKALFVLLFLGTVVTVVMASLTVPGLEIAPETPHIQACIPLNFKSYSWVSYLSGTVLESVLFFLAIGKTIDVVLSKDSRLAIRSGLMFILLRDSIVSYGGIFAFLLANLLIWAIGRQSLRAALPVAVPTVQSIIGCRMMLNMYEVAHRKRQLADAMDMELLPTCPELAGVT